MTAPVDPRPYAGPADLVTAADVAEWLDTLHKGPPDERIFGVQDAVAALDERLDRERRQACRRGARYYIVQARAHYDDAARWPTLAPTEWDYPTECAEWVARSVQCLRSTLARALAFRAAARQP